MLSRVLHMFCVTAFLLLTQGALTAAVLPPSHLRIGSYAAPVGIPEPPFGINETAPETATYCPNWPSAAGGGAQSCYYIDSSSAAATDTSNPYGYPIKPRMTIPLNYTAGSYVEIHGGPYIGSTLQINVPGTASFPIWFRGIPGAMPSIQREIVPNGSYTIFEYLNFNTNNSSGIHFRARGGTAVSDHMAIRYSTITGPGTLSSSSSAVNCFGDSTHQMQYLVWYRNTVSNFGDFSQILTKEQDFHAFAPGEYCDHVWVLENTAFDITGDGCQIGAATLTGAAVPHEIYVGGNDFYHTGENCVDIKKSAYVIVSSNTGHGFSASNHDPGGAIVIHNGPDNIWILNNSLYQAAFGIVSSGSTGLHVLGNTVFDIHHDVNSGTWNPDSAYSDGAGIMIYGSATADIVGNTVWGSDKGVQTDSGTSYHFVNNIIGGRTQASGFDVGYGNSAVATSSQFDNNIIYYSGGAARIRWGGGTILNVAGVQSSFSKCINCLEQDPQFVNPSSPAFDFHLQSSSTAIDHGAKMSVYDTFQSFFGLDIRYDIGGTERPRGSGWDIGAFEK